MSLAMIQRLVISSWRGKVDIDAYRRIVPTLNILRETTTVIKAVFPVHHTCITHKRPFYDSAVCLEKINSKENGAGIIDNISTFQIKKRPSRRNRVIINDDKIPKSNVSSLCQDEELKLYLTKSCNKKKRKMYM